MAPLSKLESNFQTEFSDWQKQPNKQTTGQLLRKLQPVIDRGIRAHVGPQTSPVLRSRARKIALDALGTYDQERSQLGTHVTNHLKGLRRASRQQQQVLRVPERVSLNQHLLAESEAELHDQLGREPSLPELADHTGLSRDRIRYIRNFRPPVAEGSLLSSMEGGGEEASFMPSVEQDSTPMVLEAVYGDLEATNQKILDWTLGLHGMKQLSNQDIARRLRLTPGAISQRKAQIQQRINDMERYDLF